MMRYWMGAGLLLVIALLFGWCGWVRAAPADEIEVRDAPPPASVPIAAPAGLGARVRQRVLAAAPGKWIIVRGQAGNRALIGLLRRTLPERARLYHAGRHLVIERRPDPAAPVPDAPPPSGEPVADAPPPAGKPVPDAPPPEAR